MIEADQTVWSWEQVMRGMFRGCYVFQYHQQCAVQPYYILVMVIINGLLHYMDNIGSLTLFVASLDIYIIRFIYYNIIINEYYSNLICALVHTCYSTNNMNNIRYQYLLSSMTVVSLNLSRYKYLPNWTTHRVLHNTFYSERE